jgi:uncharacterized membrane protein
MGNEEGAALTEDKMFRPEALISYLLRGGVAISFVLIVLGTTISFIRHPDYLRSHEALQRLTIPGHALPHTWSEIASGILQFRGELIVVAGLLVLIATPILRVAVMVAAFYYQGDRLFALIAATVLCLLLLSFVLGKVE